jgi:hypothetical protein
MMKDKIRAEIDQIERSAMCDQLGWKLRLDRATDHDREVALRTTLELPAFERWRVLKMMLADDTAHIA